MRHYMLSSMCVLQIYCPFFCACVCVCTRTYIVDKQVTRFWLPSGRQDSQLRIWMISQHATAGAPSKHPTHCAMYRGQIQFWSEEQTKSSLIWFTDIWSYINPVNLLYSSYTRTWAHTSSANQYSSCFIVEFALAHWTLLLIASTHSSFSQNADCTIR